LSMSPSFSTNSKSLSNFSFHTIDL
jgi:hypothetical protein